MTTQQLPGPDAALHPVVSAGGLTIRLPDGWQELHTDQHLAVFVGDDPSTPDTGFAPTCVLTELPGTVTLELWWEGFQEDIPGPLLLEGGEDETGFAASFSQVAEGISVTGLVRGFRLPGRTVIVTAQFATAVLDRYLPLAARIGDSLEVEGLT